ncbi:MAG: (Na+)-NQR maturation NqrM [Thiothrix sp.]|nr:(Na+)-NQR maturation NqrM [Thiothrix sp.]HPQ94020.1 (Na+)-NQR maturation NqrM [Thiolinea sp.]
MLIFFISFLFFGLAMLGLASGWLLNRRTLKGSCGGLSAIPGMENSRCACSSPCEKRRRLMAEADGSS